jgi:pyruvyltransferase
MKYPLYWIRSSNFGDALNADIYKLITGREPLHSVNSPRIIAEGSLLGEARPKDIVWGTGAMTWGDKLEVDKTTEFLAVRGPLSAEVIRNNGLKSPTIYGDPAQVLPKFYQPGIKKIHPCGVVPHYVDREKVESWTLPEGMIIVNALETLRFVDKILECEKIISSSLHGLIVAEAYGMPAVWVEFSDGVAGNGFKFHDYYLSTGRSVDPIDCRDGIAVPNTAFQKPPVVDIRDFLSVCPFEREQELWKDVNALPQCLGRNQMIADMIHESESVFEFGAGRMELKDLLPKSCRYIPSDIINRGCMQIDLNADIPELWDYDVAILSGVLEFLDNVPRVIGMLKGFPAIIFSYACRQEETIEWRRYNNWQNDYTEDDILLLFAAQGFSPLVRKMWNGQVIFRMEKLTK